MVVLEAMAAGLPVVSTFVEGIPEVIDDGQEGLLVEPGNVGQLAKALAELVGDKIDVEKMGDAGRRRQQETFSDLSMARGVAAVYDEVLST